MNKKVFKQLRKSIQEMKDIQSGKKRPRRTWIINPKTRVKDSRKTYNRSLGKKEIRDVLKNEDF